MKTALSIGLAFALLLIAAPSADAFGPTKGAGKGDRKGNSTASSATSQRPDSRRAKPRRVTFRISPASERKKAEMTEDRKNFTRSPPHRAKRKKSGNRKQASTDGSNSENRSTFDSRRGALDFNDSRTKRYGQRDMPAINPGKSLRSSSSTVLEQQSANDGPQ
ncbi:MAG: hypothetical protein AAGA33_14575 [Pseudomonadota bacterium]